MTTTRHATRAEFVAHIARLAAQGFQFDASIVSDNNSATFQPLVIAYRGQATVYLRFNAMAEDIHYWRRPQAFAAAEKLIAAGEAELARADADYEALAYCAQYIATVQNPSVKPTN